jgi:CubicO group peptidase (beta-lactamase class C family)
MKNRIVVSCILSLLLVVSVCLAQLQLPQSKVDGLVRTIHEEMQQSGAPGAVFAIVQGDKIVYEGAFGVANVETGMPMTTSTVFAMASVTKFFTALALLTAVEEQDLGVNTTAGSVVSGLSEKPSALTLHHLLSQSAGILDWWPNTNECKESLFEYFQKAGDRAVFIDQGSVFSYSNNGFALAGLMLSRLKQMSYTMAIDSIVCVPLGMNHTTFRFEEAAVHAFAAGHSKNFKTGLVIPSAPRLTDPVIQPAGDLQYGRNSNDVHRLYTRWTSEILFGLSRLGVWLWLVCVRTQRD